MRKLNLKGAAIDSVLLTGIKLVTTVFGLVVTKLMSVHFSLIDYGTYSQALLIVSLFKLGLTNTSNFFYNSSKSPEEREKYIATIFGIEYIAGTAYALLVIALQTPIVNYYNNENLRTVLFYAAWMPLFQQLLAILQVLFVSCGKAKVIAVRNFVISVCRLIIVAVACYITKSIKTIILTMLLLEIAQFIIFMISFSRMQFRIRLKDFSSKLLPEILRFSIPMMIYLLTNEISRDVDKYVIGYLMDTENLAIYTNASKILPFDLVTASFITVLIPIVTRQIGSGNYTDAEATYKQYLRIGYLATWILAFGVVINAKEAMLFLYDEKYLPGLWVFVVYVFVDMIKFANTSLILVAKGKSRVLMWSSIGAMTANLFLNIGFYYLFGFIGPAITTLLVTLAYTILILHLGAKEIGSTVLNLFDWKEMGIVAAEMIVVGGAVLMLKRAVSTYITSFLVNLIVFYGAFVTIIAVLNKNRILSCLKAINKAK